MLQQQRVLRVITKIFLPFILLFGLYVQFHGDFGPGGGFQAGVIFAAGIILYALVFGLDAARRALPAATNSATRFWSRSEILTASQKAPNSVKLSGIPA